MKSFMCLELTLRFGENSNLILTLVYDNCNISFIFVDVFAVKVNGSDVNPEICVIGKTRG